MTSADVVFSMDAQANPDTGSAYTASFNGFVESFEAVDDHTVKLVAKDVFAQIVFHGNSYCPIMAKHIWEGVDPQELGQRSGQHRRGSEPRRWHRSVQDALSTTRAATGWF